MAAKVDIERLKVRLMKDYPFFGALLHTVTFEVTEAIPTAGINGDNHLMINPKFWETKTDDEKMFVGGHEILHGCLLHYDRMQRYPADEDKALYNIAADYLVNFMLEEMKCGTRPKDALYDVNYTPDKYTVEELMEHLRKTGKVKFQKIIVNSGAGEPGSCKGGPGNGDDIIQQSSGKNTPTEQRKRELEAQQALAAAVIIAKKRGNLPGSLERLISELIKPEVNWKDQLRDWFNVKVKTDTTWNRPNRKFINSGIYLPTKYSLGCGHIGVAIDVSGSISERELVVFESELRSIFDETHPKKVTIIYFDTQTHGPFVFEDGEEISLKRIGGGGTNFAVAFDWFTKNASDITGLVFMTDMMCDWPSEPLYPTCILSTTKGITAPFGRTIYANIKETGY